MDDRPKGADPGHSNEREPSAPAYDETGYRDDETAKTHGERLRVVPLDRIRKGPARPSYRPGPDDDDPGPAAA